MLLKLEHLRPGDDIAKLHIHWVIAILRFYSKHVETVRRFAWHPARLRAKAASTWRALHSKKGRWWKQSTSSTCFLHVATCCPEEVRICEHALPNSPWLLQAHTVTANANTTNCKPFTDVCLTARVQLSFTMCCHPTRCCCKADVWKA